MLYIQKSVLSVERLGKQIGRVSDDEMTQTIEGLNALIGEQTTFWGLSARLARFNLNAVVRIKRIY